MLSLTDFFDVGYYLDFNEKTKALSLQKFGLFYRPNIYFLVALEYLRGVGQHAINATIYNKINTSTKIGSKIAYDLIYSRITTDTAVRYRLNELSKIRLKANNFGKLDFGLSSRVNPNLKIVFNTGGNMSSVLGEKSNPENFYTGINFKVTM